MERPVVVVELLGAAGQVRYRTRLTSLPATIGRSYACEVLIDDPHIEARHAEIVRDEAGTLRVRDLGSVNGIAAPRGGRVPELALSSGDRVRIGPAELRVIEADHPLPAAVPMPAERDLTRGMLAPLRATAVLLGALAVFVLVNYQSTTDADALIVSVQYGVSALAALGFWALAWALATRIVSSRFRFLAHWAWAAGLAVAFTVASVLGDWVDFATPAVEAGTWVAGALALALLPLFVAGHLEIASTMSTRARWRAGFAVMGIAVAASVLFSLGDDSSANTWSLEYPGQLKPLPAALIGGVTLDEFMDASGALQADVDAMAEDAPEEGDAPPPDVPKPDLTAAPDSVPGGA